MEETFTLVKVKTEEGEIKEFETASCCPHHIDEYPTPMIGTLAFMGSEQWCPHCGYTCGWPFGRTADVQISQELYDRFVSWKKYTKDEENGFLHAKGALACSSLEYKGKDMTYKELPQAEKNRLEKIRKDWSYERKIEEITA